MRIIDSSSIVKFVSHEPGWEGVERHLIESITLNMAIVEFANALRKKISKNEMQPSDAIKLFNDYSERAFVIDQNRYLQQALEISISKGSTVYDSVFIAAALQTGFDLVSSDGKQLKIAEELGIKTIKC